MDKMLDVLDDDYKELIHVVQARDISITFKELHENYMTLKPWCYQPTLSIFTFQPLQILLVKLYNVGIHPLTLATITLPNILYLIKTTTIIPRPRATHLPLARIIPLVYILDTIKYADSRHSAKQYPQYRLVPNPSNTNYSHTPLSNPPISWQPRAHYASNHPSSLLWLLNNGASHHVTSDLKNISLHTPYNGSDVTMIGDGSSLPITHIGSTSLTTSTHNF